MRAERNDAGFTLVEVLVSLAIFSIAVLGLNRAATLAVSGTSELTVRTHAGFVADNAVVLSRMERVEIGTERSEATSGGMTFDVGVTTSATELPGFHEIVVDVREADADQIIASRRAFRFDAPDAVDEEPLDEAAP